jgi:hypothetical protein
MPTPNPILKLSASLRLPVVAEPELLLELDPVAVGTLVDLLDDEGVSARMLVATAGVEPEKVSERPRKESVVGVVNFTLRIR